MSNDPISTAARPASARSELANALRACRSAFVGRPLNAVLVWFNALGQAPVEHDHFAEIPQHHVLALVEASQAAGMLPD